MHKKLDKSSKAFSLIELLIVIIIISLVYFLGFSGIEKQVKKTKAITPLNLKSTIINSELFQGKGTFMCINQCKSCYLRRDIYSPFEEYEESIDLKEIKVHTLDSFDNFNEKEYGRYQDEKVCLIIEFYKNGSSTQLVLEKDDKFYFLPSFFKEPKEVKSLNEAKELWLKYNSAVASQGDFYWKQITTELLHS